MNWRQLWNAGKQLITRGLQQIETKVKEWTKPAPDRQITGVAADLVLSKPELVAENAFLRQQVIVLKRQSLGRPSITPHDRRMIVMFAGKLRGCKEALHIVKPDTVTKWHRQGFRLFWRRKSQGQARKPRISPEAIALIKERAIENRLWGSLRIRDELLKLGFKVAKRTVQKYMHQAARRGLPPERK